MRTAKEIDYWDKVYARKYNVGLKKINLDGLNGFDKVFFSDGIFVLCGLNGVGKSTIIAAIKDVLGLQLTENDSYKLKNSVIKAEFQGETMIQCTNIQDERLIDKQYNIENIYFLDSLVSQRYQDFCIHQKHFEDLVEQAEEYTYSDDEIIELNYLVGKRYQECSVREFEDIEKLGVVPYFCVKIDDMEYDSRSMGSGEHLLMYLFWCINKCSKDTIVIIEEPETYISIYSQMHFSNYLGKMVAQKGIQVIITTHSPYLLNHVKNENIRIVSRMGNMATIMQPNENMIAEDILGVERNCMGTLFVEDRVASDFLSIILENKAPYILKKYTIDIVGGEAEITKRLRFPKSDKIQYNFIGVYDGDMREALDKTQIEWKYVFLPGNKPLEELYRNFLHSPQNIDKLCSELGRELNEMITMLATIDGDDYHDWFEKLRKFLSVDGRTLVRTFYKIMNEMEYEIEQFIEDIKKCLE